MRSSAVVMVCLAGIIAWAIGQSLAQKAELLAAKPLAVEKSAKLVEQQPAVQAAQPIAKPAEAPIVQAVAEPTAKPAEQSAVQASLQHEANPVEKPIVQAAAQPVAKPVETLVVQAVAEPAAKPAEQSVVQASVQHEANPVEKPIVQAALEPEVKSIEPAAALSAVEPAHSPAAQQAGNGCPGNPDALGTSRVLTIKPTDFPLLGTIQYKQTLPLRDHEVVLTFDDGPIPPYTSSILDTLAAQCVKATYFLVGEMARARPYLVRRIYNEGHTIGTHSQTHPFAFQHLSIERVANQVNGGIESAEAALGNPKALSPFFRIPGLGRTNAIENFLESKGLATWSADIDTDDWWRGSTPGAIVQRAMRRLNEKGRGIILMHDIHPATALALPTLLKELKANGYHVVQVVAEGDRPKTLPDLVATPAETEAWPRVIHADAEQGGPAKRALRHRVKQALNEQHHRRRVVERKDVAIADVVPTASVWHHPY